MHYYAYNTKDLNEENGGETRIRIRKEPQEYPSIRLDAAVNEKLHCIGPD